MADQNPNPKPPYGYPGEANYPVGGRTETKKSLFQLLQVMRRGFWLILGVGLLVFSVIAIVTFLTPKRYQASSTLLVEQPVDKREDNALSAGRVFGVGSDSENRSTQAVIMEQSIDIAERTIERLRDMKVNPETGDPLFIFEDAEELRDKLNREPTVRDWAAHLQNKFVNIRPEGDHRVGAIRVSATSESPTEAALVANTFVEEYVAFSKESSSATITSSRAFLEEQIARAQEEVLTLEGAISEYRRSNNAIDLTASSTLAVTQIAQYRQDVNETRVQKLMREETLRQLEAQLAALQPRLTERVSSTTEVELQEAQTQLRNTRRLVEGIYTRYPDLRENPESNPTLVQLLTDIDKLQSRVDELSNTYVQEFVSSGGSSTATGGAATDPGLSYAAEIQNKISEEKRLIAAADARIAQLERTISRETRRVQAIPRQSAELAQMERDYQIAQTNYLNLEAKLQEARIAEESTVSFASILRPALKPNRPFAPNTGKNLVLGAVLAMLMGIGAALGKHWMDSRIHTPDDVAETGQKLLGAIPDMRPVIKSEFNDRTTMQIGKRTVSTTLAPLLTPASPISEAYRRLFVNLQHCIPNKHIQTILVTSPEAEVGKSTTSLNLAITAARSGRKTLIIDADFHRPSLAQYLGIKQAADIRVLLAEIKKHMGKSPYPTLRSHLDGGRHKNGEKLFGKDGALSLEKYNTGISNLYALAPLKPIADSAEFLNSNAMQFFMNKLRDEFDLIVIDTPPVLLTTDAAILSTQTDMTIFVVSAGRTDIGALTHAVQEIESIGSRVAGTILNRFDPSKVTGYKYTYQYRYQYYSKYYKPETEEIAVPA